jgi:hypothetical protein
MTYDRLVAGYLSHAAAVAHDQKDTHFWAYLGLHRLVEQKPDDAWPLVVEVIRSATDEEVLGYVAADILEDLICEHSQALIDRVEVLAHEDEHFKRALAHVWGWTRIPPEVRTRLDVLVSGDSSPSEDAG